VLSHIAAKPLGEVLSLGVLDQELERK